MRSIMFVLSFLLAIVVPACKQTTVHETVTTKVVITEQMYSQVTCRLEDDRLVWAQDNPDQDFKITAIKDTITTFITFETNEGSYDIVMARYIPLGVDSRLKILSFYFVDYWGKEIKYKKLNLPNECTFVFKKKDGYYVITNIVKSSG